MGRQRRHFGHLRKLPSGRWQAKYVGPDGRTYTAPTTYDAKQYGDAWLSRVHAAIQAGTWVSPNAPKAITFGSYATAWVADRDLRPRTRVHYRSTLDKVITPTFGDMSVASISPGHVRTWYASLGTRTPTKRAHAYSLLKTIFNSG